MRLIGQIQRSQRQLRDLRPPQLARLLLLALHIADEPQARAEERDDRGRLAHERARALALRGRLALFGLARLRGALARVDLEDGRREVRGRARGEEGGERLDVARFGVGRACGFEAETDVFAPAGDGRGPVV